MILVANMRYLTYMVANLIDEKVEFVP